MQIFPTESEVSEAANLLVNTYDVSSHLLGELFGKAQRDQASSIIQQRGGARLDRSEVAKLLVFKYGSELFGGSDDAIRKLRHRLLSKLPSDEVVRLFSEHYRKTNHITQPTEMLRPLAEKINWHPGGRWARAFVHAMRFPLIFAGVVQRDNSPTFELIQPRYEPPSLVDFQIGLKDRMKQVLDQEGAKTRCVVTLPTGGGKTRVAVEAFLDWMMKDFSSGKYLLWIAQNEELCEQCLKCIQQMWSSRPFIEPLRVYRYFGGRDIPEDDLRGGAVVSSIQQLHNRIKGGDLVLEEILRNTGAMIIDEAHRAVSNMYDGLLEKAEQVCGTELFPICGLTATPGRAGVNHHLEIPKLVGRFQAHLIKPDIGKEYQNDPLEYFRKHGYLARANHKLFKSGAEYELTEGEFKQMGESGDLPPGFLKRLAQDEKRNSIILDRLLSIPAGTPTLVYACTVEHAELLAALLNKYGCRAGAISSDTPLTIRRGLIQGFKEGGVGFLCNFGVLTTGFDAPKTRCIVICRPTRSVVLYEQIVGRGLRGPKFGGTEECDVVDFADNILRLGQPISYARFADVWNEATERRGSPYG